MTEHAHTHRHSHGESRRHREKRSEENRLARSVNLGKVVFFGTFGLLMFGPIAFGAVEPWSIFGLEAGALLLTLAWFARQWMNSELDIHYNPLLLPMGVFAALVAVQLVFRVSAYPHDTWSQALLYCAYAMLCFLSSQTLLRTAQARQLAWMFCVFGFIVAAFALLQGIAPNGKLYWVRVPRLGGWIYGSYVNHNHYAGLMELLVPIPLVLALTRLADRSQRIVAAITAAIMVGTIFLSGSRGGILAIFFELVLLGVVLLRQKKTTRIAVAAGGFVVLLVGLLVWLGGRELTTRLTSISIEAHSEISGGTRLSIDRDTLHMFRQRPVLGWGLGTFPVVYPQFRSFYTNFFVNEAHNDYLQLLAETGVLGFATMVWFVIVLYRKALPKIRNWMSDVGGAVTLTCMLGVSGILVHSFFDFNLQIPANAALFYVMCTVAAAPSLRHRSHKHKPVPAAASQEQPVFPASEVV
jgi:O-antigen ligase